MAAVLLLRLPLMNYSCFSLVRRDESEVFLRKEQQRERRESGDFGSVKTTKKAQISLYGLYNLNFFKKIN